MIPSVVARQVRETVLDYLRTTFDFSDADFERALFNFLGGGDGLFRGPYLDLRLPFRKADENEKCPLDIAPDFRPYKHQQRAFLRLYTRGGHQPQHTIVTTGTGSGKTECFLFPVLDHCLREKQTGRKGIKAILLYPMNALATDQARRLAEMLHEDDRLRGNVTAGLYVGGSGSHGVATTDNLVDQRDVLRDSPPDILLTNYRMLDFLLLRPEDKKLWRHNGPDTLRYLVLDELHTYDGAQGSDVACLIRRLKSRLGARAGSVCCVGTSATIGGKTTSETIGALTEFAGQVFGEDFFEDAVITEDREEADEAFPQSDELVRYPDSSSDGYAALAPEQFESADAWLAQQARIWLGEDVVSDDALDPLEVGRRLARHDLLRPLLRATAGVPQPIDRIVELLSLRVPSFEALGDARFAALDSFLALMSFARREEKSRQDAPPRQVPFLALQIQLWIGELTGLLQRITADAKEGPVFAWAHDQGRQELTGSPGAHDPLDADNANASDEAPPGSWIRVAHCRECGANGLAGFQAMSDAKLQTAFTETGEAWLRNTPSARYVTFGHDRDEGAASDDPSYLADWLCPNCLQFGTARDCDCSPAGASATNVQRAARIPVRISDDTSSSKPPYWFLARCPDCGSDDALRILGSRAASLLSVAISHLYLSDYNRDKKLLAFTDSVQDASHRAGFFGARTYRFNLRTAVQGVLEARDGEIPLTELAGRMTEHWDARLGTPRRIATLLPSDLSVLPEYERFRERAGTGRHDRLENILESRIAWEATMEYGLTTRVGRTLESSMCSTVRPDPDAVEAATDRLALEIEEESPFASALKNGISKDALRAFLDGILWRTRMRGGIDHPFLRGYAASGGKWFLLTKRKQPHVSPFHSESILPRLLTDRTKASGEKRELVFDTILSTPKQYTWYRDQAARVLGVDRRDDGINDLMRTAVQALESAGLLNAHALAKSASSKAWALSPSKLRVTTEVAAVVCDTCRRRVVVATPDLPTWTERACVAFRCRGRLRPADSSEPSYYGEIYRSGRLERIFPFEHTGLLSREEREQVEERFKKGREADPDAPNLLVATPTLEMGIDIGDLSATVLCSVPPTTANYLQRIGRAGRKTGNSLCLTMTLSRPHDLYFRAQPLEMMAGQVLPPGCFLEAPEMLKRQLVAHAMDRWADQEESVRNIPRKASLALSGKTSVAFPGRFLEYFREHRDAIVASFEELFPVDDKSHRHRIREWAAGDSVPTYIEKAFADLKSERDEIGRKMRAAKRRIDELEKSGSQADEVVEELREQSDTRKMLSRIFHELGKKYPLNVLTDAGLLPNYAFPEPGVVLDAVIVSEGQGGKRKYSGSEYRRAASVAIRELAPFNTFYAEGHKVRINEVDLGTSKESLVEQWRLCPECNHMERLLDRSKTEARSDRSGPDATNDESSKDAGSVTDECPRCLSPNWADNGQVRSLVPFRRSRALVTRAEASTSDETEDRQSEHYQILDLIDVAPENYNGARLIAERPFGYELLKNLQLREVNFGKQKSGSLRVSGHTVPEEGFEVCADCGRVRQDHKELDHAPYCRSRKKLKADGAAKTPTKERIEPIFLYRQIRSEAIRILLPVAEVDVEGVRASFKAALDLGLRRRFRGDPGHLQVKPLREPLRGGTGHRHFLVLFDAVPGGTGYLSEIWQGDNFLHVLELAHKAIRGCDCWNDPHRDGCYRCLFGYQRQHELESVSARNAERLLRSILDERDSLEEVDTLSDVPLDARLESELEYKFVAALQERFDSIEGASMMSRLRDGEEEWILRFQDDSSWRLRTQFELGSMQGVSLATRADFLLEPLESTIDTPVLPVAVYCDGFEFHACPDQANARIADDIAKRRAILESGRFAVWTVTWKDVQAFEGEKKTTLDHPFLGGAKSALLGKVLEQVGSALPRDTALEDSMDLLFSYLRHPDREAWRRMAGANALAWLLSSPELDADAAARAENLLGATVGRLPLPDAVPGAKGSTVLGRLRGADADSFVGLLKATAAQLAKGDWASTRVVLRIFDDAESRSRPATFEPAWRRFFQAWNVLQFHDNHLAASSEWIRTEQPDRTRAEEPRPSVMSDELTGAALPHSGAGIAADKFAPFKGGRAADTDPQRQAEIDELLEFASSDGSKILNALRDSSLPLPDLEYELDLGHPGTGAEPDLAWPDAKIAVLAQRQAEDRPAFERVGWTVFEHPVDIDSLIGLLRGSRQ